MKPVINLAGSAGLIAAIVAMFGFLGQLDYEAEREAECASYLKPHRWDKVTDACVPIVINVQPEEYYRAAPKESRSIRH